MIRDLGRQSVESLSPKPDRGFRALAPLAPSTPMPPTRYTAPSERDFSRQRRRRPTRNSERSRNEAAPTAAEPNRSSVGVPTPRLDVSTTAADLQAFKQMFVFHKYDYAIQNFDWQRRLRWEWCRIPTERHPPLSDAELLAHLDQRASLAAYAKRCEREDGTTGGRISTTRHLLIDLDIGNGHDDVLARATIVRQALGSPTFALSSPGGGAHLIYVFEHEVPLFQLRGPGGVTGAAIDLLTYHGLPERRGVMEVFPAACSWLAKENVCRLPFGPGAYLLDLDRLSIEDSTMFGVRALRHISEQLASGELEYVNESAWREQSLKLPIIRRPRPDGVLVSAQTIAQPYLDHGLRAYGERRRAIRALAYHWWWESQGEEDAVRLAKDWLIANHNNCSKDWNAARDKRRLLADCEDVVRLVYARRRSYMMTRNIYTPLLTLSEVQPLVDLAMAVAAQSKAGCPAVVTVRTKTVRIDPVKLVDFGVHILQFFVRRLEQIALLAFEHSHGRFDQTYRRVIKRCRPDVHAQRFRLPLPKRAMTSFVRQQVMDDDACSGRRRVVGRDSVAAYMQFLLKQLPESFSLASNYFAQGRKCRDYWVHVDLLGDRVVSSGADAWIRTESARALRPDISRHVWNTKLRADVEASARRFTTEVSAPMFALDYLRRGVADAIEVQRSMARVSAGIFSLPVEPNWQRDDPERHLLALPAGLRTQAWTISAALAPLEPLRLAPFVRMEHLRDLLPAIRARVDEAVQAALPATGICTSLPNEIDAELRIEIESADGTQDPATIRMLKRALKKAITAATRDVIWCSQLHLLPAEHEAELADSGWGHCCPPR